MKKISFLLLAIFLAHNIYALHINEIMYDPLGNDNNKEFIEIYLDGGQGLENWTIADQDSNDTLILLYHPNAAPKYALIVEEGYAYIQSNYSVYSAGAAIGNNLNNDKDTVCLYDPEGLLMGCESYNNTYANGNGFSLEFCNGTWMQSIIENGTPGNDNSACAIYPDTSKHNISHNTTNTTPANTTFPLASNASEDESPCVPGINISTEKDIISLGEKIRYTFHTHSENFIIEYWIEDIYSNIVKNKYNTTNKDKKTWTPSKEGAYIIHCALYDLGCPDSPQPQSHASYLVAAKGEKETYTSSIKITSAQDTAAFGERIEIALDIKKGDTTKKTIYAYIRDEKNIVSEKTKASVPSKNVALSLTLPLQIKPDCSRKYNDGDYEIIVEGLGEEDSAAITIEGISSKLCIEKETIITEAIETESSHEPRIKSFYSLVKKYSPEINLFATFENIAQPQEIIIHSYNSTISKEITGNLKTTIPVPARPKKNLYVLELKISNTTKDFAYLTIDFTIPDDEDKQMPDPKSPEKLTSKKQVLEHEKASGLNLPDDDDTSTITAHAIAGPKETAYESASEKAKTRISWFFIPLFLTLLVMAGTSKKIRKIFKQAPVLKKAWQRQKK